MQDSSITNNATAINEWAIPEPPAHSTTEPIYLPLPYTPERFDAVILAAGLEFRYNLRSHRQQWRRVPWLGEEPEGWTPLTGWQDWTDTTSTLLRAELPTAGVTIGNRRGLIEDALGVLTLTAKQFEDAVHLVCARNAVDPFLTYVQDETPRWDRIPRLSGWLVQCFDVADGSYDLAEWAGEFVFLGAVQRAMQPGSKLDETPVLIGPPGIGKSTALRLMFPPDLQDLFTDGLNLSSDTKTRVESLQSRAVVEIGEMAGARRADVESLKAFLSRTDDGSTRLSYRHNPEPMPRRCIIVGTADRSDPLPPDHNLRRFVPVTLDGGDVGRLIAFMDANRGQLWAEALYRVEHGQDARLPDWLKEQQREATDGARYTDAIQDAVERYLEAAPEWFTLEAVAYAVGLIDNAEKGATITPVDQSRLGAALRQCGYQRKRKRVDGVLKYGYCLAA